MPNVVSKDFHLDDFVCLYIRVRSTRQPFNFDEFQIEVHPLCTIGFLLQTMATRWHIDAQTVRLALFTGEHPHQQQLPASTTLHEVTLIQNTGNICSLELRREFDNREDEVVEVRSGETVVTLGNH